MADSGRETLDVDVLFVGAGPASLAGAIQLMKLAQAHNELAEKSGGKVTPLPNIAVVEKGHEVGAQQISGAVINPKPLRELIPDFLEKGCPLESEVTDEGVYFLTAKKALKFPILPPQFHNDGNYVASLSKVTRWLGEQATAMEINIFTSFAATEILYEGDRVVGIATGDKGVDSKGNRKPNFEQGVNIRAKCTVFGEGVRGFLTKSLIPKLGLQEGKQPQTFETGVKEVWQCQPGKVKPGLVIHTMGYPLSNDTVGGSFIYGMKDNLLVIGLVVSLDYSDPFIEPYIETQKLKQHPLIAKMIEGGKQVAYGAKAISSGGYYAVPRLHFDGGCLIGESAQLLDMSRLKGVHIGMHSGMLAAQTIFNCLRDEKSFNSDDLQPYEKAIYDSQIGKDLYRSRNFHQALAKGIPMAFLHLGLQQITGGRGLIDPMPTILDRKHYQTVKERYGRQDAPIPPLENKTNYVEKLTSVFNAGTLHDENQPCHLKIRDFNTCYDKCHDTYREPCNRFCPAKVYETLNEGGKLRLQINFTNCVHCQTCDIKCPEDNILWTPPEGGGGPRYSIL